MSKKLLLAASALAVVGYAGVAGATDIKGTAAPFAGVTTSGTSTPALLASEATLTTANAASVFSSTFTGEIAPTSGNWPSGQLVLTISLSEGAAFGVAAPVVGTLFPDIGNGTATTCTPHGVAVSEGGGATDRTVSYFISGLETCTTASPLRIAGLPVRSAASGSTSLTIGLKTVTNLTVDGAAKSVDLVRRAASYALVYASNTGVAATALLPGYTTLAAGTGTTATTASQSLGTVQLSATPNVYVALGGTGSPTLASSASPTSVAFTLTGNNSGLKFDIGGTAVSAAGTATLTNATTPTVATLASSAQSINVSLNPSTATPPVQASIVGGSYSIVGNINIGTGYSTIAGTPTALKTINRAGTTVFVPWIGSASQAGSNGVASQIRIGNRGAAVGAVYARILTSGTVEGYSAPQAPVALGSERAPWGSTGAPGLVTGIPAGGELVITQADLERALGHWGRGDIEIIVEGDSGNLSIFRRDTRGSELATDIPLGANR